MYPEELTIGVSSSQALFLCEYSSIIPSTLSWLRDGLEVSSETDNILIEYSNTSDSVLQILNPDILDSGSIYTCMVNNSIGVQNTSGLLTVGKSNNYFHYFLLL